MPGRRAREAGLSSFDVLEAGLLFVCEVKSSSPFIPTTARAFVRPFYGNPI